MWSNIILDGEAQPPGRSKHAVAFDGQYLYMFGGKSGTFPLKDFWKLDLRGGKWTQIKANRDEDEWPPPLQEHTMVQFGGKLYVFGGEIGMTDDFATPLWIYSIQLNEWNKWSSSEINRRNKLGGKGLTPLGRRGHSAAVYHSYMIIYGGYRDLKGSLGDLWAYHFESDSWHLFFKPPANRYYWSSNPTPSPRHNQSMVQYNEYVYIYGGMNNLDEKCDLWKYNFDSRKWANVKVKNGPGALRGHVACKGLGNMFIIGGERDGKFIDEVWRFCFGTETFHRLIFHGCHPCPRVFPACTMLPAIVKSVPKSSVSTSNTISNFDDIGASPITDNKYWWDDEITTVSAPNNGYSQNPLKNINIIRDFSNRLNNHRLGNYQVLESATVEECGLNNSCNPGYLNSPSSTDDGLTRIDEEKLIEIDDIQVRPCGIQGILNTTRRSESVSNFQPGTKSHVRKSASSVRFADYNMPNSTSDYMSMETLIEDYKLKDPTGSIDGTGTYFRNNGEDIEMTCFSSAVPSDVLARPRKPLKSNLKEENVQVVTTPNYLLLVGGLESHTTHLIKKPLSIWRLRVCPEMIHQQNSI